MADERQLCSEQSLVDGCVYFVLSQDKVVKVGPVGVIAVLVGLLMVSIGMLSYVRPKAVVMGLFILPPAIGRTALIGANHYLSPRFFFFPVGFAVLVVIRGLRGKVRSCALSYMQRRR